MGNKKLRRIPFVIAAALIIILVCYLTDKTKGEPEEPEVQASGLPFPAVQEDADILRTSGGAEYLFVSRNVEIGDGDQVVHADWNCKGCYGVNVSGNYADSKNNTHVSTRFVNGQVVLSSDLLFEASLTGHGFHDTRNGATITGTVSEDLKILHWTKRDSNGDLLEERTMRLVESR